MVSLLGIMLVLQSANVTAQEGGSLPVQQFVPIPGGSNYITVAGSDGLDHTKQTAGLYLNYARHPLVLRTLNPDTNVALVSNHLQMDLLAAIGLWDRLELGLAVPVTLFQNAEESEITTRNLSAVTAGDIKLFPKWSFIKPKSSGFGLAFMTTLTLPTGDPDSLQGNASVTFEPRVVLEYKFSRKSKLAANLGYTIREQQSFLNIDVGNEFSYGLAWLQTIKPETWDVIVEGYGKSSLDSDVEKVNVEELPLEGSVNARYHIARGHALTAGVGAGLTQGYGSPQVRTLFGYAFTEGSTPDTDGDGYLDPDDACPLDPEDFDSFEDADGCPEPDNDNDKVCDPWVTERQQSGKYTNVCLAIDGCPMDPEDMDKFEDEDGCPDPDNDQDGVLDVADTCPLIPEDIDGWEDLEGCPDPDNDKDGICDPWVAKEGKGETYKSLCKAEDLCPSVPEDFDQFQDEDGCPDPDNDEDGICDPWVEALKKSSEYPCKFSDKCPLKPETINGIKDEDGCPDRGRSKVIVRKKKIEILERIYFQFDKDIIQVKSFRILNQVAQVLNANTKLGMIEIQGHTDNAGADDYNKDLSERRAKAVLTYLVTKGNVDPNRLRSVGFGEEKPLVSFEGLKRKQLKRAQDKNRRVEFLIVAEMDKTTEDDTKVKSTPPAP